MMLRATAGAVLTAAALAAPALSQESGSEANDAEMRAMTANVLAGIPGAAPLDVPDDTGPAADPAALSDALGAIVSDAVDAGKSDDYIRSLIEEAETQGEIALPSAMTDTDGKIDVRTVLATYVQQSVDAMETAPDAAGQLEAEAEASASPADETATEPEEIVHVVAPGESLALISRRYLGNALRYEEIYELNRSVLQNPNQIFVGQELRIPNG